MCSFVASFWVPLLLISQHVDCRQAGVQQQPTRRNWGWNLCACPAHAAMLCNASAYASWSQPASCLDAAGSVASDYLPKPQMFL